LYRKRGGYPPDVPLLFRAATLLLFLFRIWRRLPARQRRRVLWAAGRHGPRIAVFALRRRARA
jgi:hypothetical protein